MMFLMVFGSLAAAMAIVAEGNLRTADTQLKVGRSLAAAETGMDFLIYRLDKVTEQVKTREGDITPQVIEDEQLWSQTAQGVVDEFSDDPHTQETPYIDSTGTVHLGPIKVGPNEPAFEARLTPHPISDENYDSPFYQRPPYDGSRAETGIEAPISSSNPLDRRFVRVTVTAEAGKTRGVTRTISMDFRIDKKIRYALLSRSRVMLGQNVMVDGPIGSRFTETHLENGHPIQVLSDFRGFSADLDDRLDMLVGTLVTNDADGDNRINLDDPKEIEGFSNPGKYDVNGDRFIDGYDFFLDEFDDNADYRISKTELDTSSNTDAAQLFELVDTFGHPQRPGYGDGFIDNRDRYAKIQGQIHLTASQTAWEGGAAGGAYQDYLQGAIRPDHEESPLYFESERNDRYNFQASDFDVSRYESRADGTLPSPTDTVREEVPYGAAHPYDYYDRPVYENETFEDVQIPKGKNAVFKNCTFIGVTFVETASDNDDEDYVYAGSEEQDGFKKYPGRTAEVDGQTVENTKEHANNLRFHDCTFEGAVIAGDPSGAAPRAYTHTRNKLSFTGETNFNIENSTHLTDSEKRLYKRSTLLAPHYSVEMGTFSQPADPTEKIRLSGTIVAGLIDMRGQVNIEGTILTTFQPKSDQMPVLGKTSPQFNTTLGYFSSQQGDLEAELPDNGRGLIQLQYNPTIPLPDGILGPIEVRPIRSTYFEGGAVDG